MLDKSIPYFDVIMCLPGGTPHPDVPELPDGYAYKLYSPGDDAAWSAIETAVDEFDSEEQAHDYFRREFAPHAEPLRKRMAFISAPDSTLIANAAAWWKVDDDQGKLPILHWVAVRPEHQGRGLGHAVACKALSLFPKAERQGDIWLMTQTWSHVAIGLYLSIGFRAHKSATIAKHKNGFDGAVRVLEKVMRPKAFARMMYTAMK